MKLRSHLLLLIVATLLPMIVFAAAASLIFAKRERATFERGARERTLALLTAIDIELRSSVTTLQALATSRNLDTGDLRAFHEEASRVHSSRPDWLTVNLAPPSGQQVVNVLRPFGTALPAITELGSFDRVVETGEPVIGSLVVGTVTKQLDFPIRVPVVREGVTKYVLSAVVKPSAIAPILASQRLPADWVAVVLDGANRIVARTVEPERTVGQFASVSLRAALANASEGWFHGSTIEGAEVYTPYNRSAWSRWTVAMGIPAAAVQAGAWRTAAAMAAGLTAAAALACVLAVLLGRRIVAPITTLAGIARAIGHGERPEVPRSATVEEVRDLGQALAAAAAAVRAREETQARLGAIVQSSADAIISYSLDTVVRTWNPGAVRVFGYTAEEMVGQTLSVLVPEDRRDELTAIVAAVQRGETRALETERKKKDGTLLPVALSASPIRDAAGAVIAVSSVVHDMTELRRAEARRRESEQTLAAVLSSVEDYIYIFDRDARFVFANKKLLDLWGLSADEAHGKTMRDLAYPPTVERQLFDGLRQVIETHSVVRNETLYTNPTGAGAYYENILAPIVDAGGRVVLIAGSSRDVTERRQAEDALREADRVKDEFLAMLGHELRNPLGAIAGAIGVLNRAATPGGQAERARAVIGRQVQHLSRLMDDLLDVSRVTTGKIVLTRAPLDLAQVTASIVGTWRSTGRFDRHDVTADLTPVWIYADETRMEQVLTNLLGNALKYTPPGGSIALRVCSEEDVAVLAIRDSGIGIPAAILERVFDVFVQGDRPLDRVQGGLGLGLTLVKRLVEMHGGTVTAHSDGPGTGSVFTVRLARIPPPSARPAQTAVSVSEGNGRRVLLIEDNDDAREMLRVALAHDGHEVHEAADGPAGVEAALRLRPDIALVDIGLPGLDGYDVARKIRASGIGRSVRLVALTGYGQTEDRQRAREAGFDAHLTKPVTAERLAEAIAAPRR